MGDADEYPCHPLIDAISQQDAAAVAAMLDAGADPNQTGIGVPALGWAVQASDAAARESIVAALLNAGANPSAALIAIAPQAHTQALDALLAAGADVNASGPDGETPLIAAVKAGHIRNIERLCGAGARVNHVDAAGRSALRWLTGLYDRPDAARLLIEHGADVNLGDADATPLAAAAFLGAARTVDLLLSARADPELPVPRIGATPLMMAAERGHAEIVHSLIVAGASVDRRDDGGWTAAMFAAREGHVPVLQILARAGADLRAVSPTHDSPLTLAEENGNDAVVAFLKERGAADRG